MRFSLLIGLLFSASVWARDDRFSHLPADCATELVSPLEIDAAMPDNPNLVFRGALTWFTDGAGREWPALRDHELGDKVSGNPEAAHAFLRPGDALFLNGKSKSRKIELEGEVARDPESGKLVVMAHDRVLISNRDLKEMVTGGREALLVRHLDEAELADWRGRLLPWLRRYRAHLAKPDRMVTIADRRFERPHFQTFFSGKPEFKYVEGGLRLWLQTQSGLVELGPGDRLFLIDDKGQIFLERRLGNDLLGLKEDLLRAKAAAAFALPF